jgi:hypothetical protein
VVRSQSTLQRQLRVIIEHDGKKNWFWPFVNAQELLEVTTKLSIKLNDPVIDVGTYHSNEKKTPL